MNMQAIGKKLSALRKERDMTQVDLADKLGVTYQAVSSWERGNSMPDIGKLPDISQVLGLSIDELLGNAKATELIKNVLSGNESPPIPPDLEALADVAPILKPSQVNTLAKQSLQSGGIDNSTIIEIACHMESEDLKEIALHCDNLTSETIAQIACFMESEDLREIAIHCEKLTSEAIAQIACYMESEDLKEIALHCDKLTGDTISQIACYMESEDLKEIILHRKNGS
jgi:transcriptional regulator with XRE-family HTH domain